MSGMIWTAQQLDCLKRQQQNILVRLDRIENGPTPMTLTQAQQLAQLDRDIATAEAAYRDNEGLRFRAKLYDEQIDALVAARETLVEEISLDWP